MPKIWGTLINLWDGTLWDGARIYRCWAGLPWDERWASPSAFGMNSFAPWKERAPKRRCRRQPGGRTVIEYKHAV